MAERIWTAEQRKQQSQKIRQWQPWQHSSGARTIEIKARVSRNAYKEGTRQLLREINLCLREQRIALNVTYESTRINGK
ncbi:MAG: hypothetical protein H7Z20_01960 [Bdellovibrio sp.]|nr:hypothetical protein [Methylotenera sp.]